jgi:hypothetical protein
MLCIYVSDTAQFETEVIKVSNFFDRVIIFVLISSFPFMSKIIVFYV